MTGHNGAGGGGCEVGHMSLSEGKHVRAFGCGEGAKYRQPVPFASVMNQEWHARRKNDTKPEKGVKIHSRKGVHFHRDKRPVLGT